jgi:hypothetical protein
LGKIKGLKGRRVIK